MTDRLPNSLGYQQITSLSAAAGLTPPASAVRALVQAETQAVRWRDDGTDPTTTVGMTLAAGASLEYEGQLAAIRFIEVTASAKLNVAYFG
jgi:predicted hotdog family 3-hydroxylacyl-ACP dehydratase